MNPGSTTNRKLFLASFLTLIAAGVGFAIRGGILGDWGSQFGFTKSELGEITGGGLVGFGITIIICSFLADLIGYRVIMYGAFSLHVLSAVVTLAATPVFNAYGKDATYKCLYWGMFLFALANGLCEAVINPLVATLYPRQKTHYLNILHAGWPGGLILGGLFVYAFGGSEPLFAKLSWEMLMAFFLVPTVLYGVLMFGEPFPHSEAKSAGISLGESLREFLAPMLLFLFVLHAMVGYVELGTDSWIINIMNNVITGKAVLLFVYTSALMFALRFFAGPIVERINPVGLLFVSAILGCIGLYWLGSAGLPAAIFAAATIYGVGKTFFWPTMLGVVGERFPKGGATTMGMIGGIGMLSAGLLGGPGIGYVYDYYAAEKLEQDAPDVYARYVSTDHKKSFLFFPPIAGLDGTKVGNLKDKINAKAQLTAQEEQDKPYVLDADIYGGRMALKWTAAVPATMAVGYLILLWYFASKGGYRAEVLHGAAPDGEKYTGGVEGPVE